METEEKTYTPRHGQTGKEKTLKALFIGHCWEYLHNNFHKFSEQNQIKIALTLAQKDMPTVMEGGLNITKMGTVKINGREQELNLGNRVAEHFEHSAEAEATNNGV